MPKMSGGRFLAETMKGYGVTHAFLVPVIARRAMVEMEQLGIRRVVTHGEKSAAYMADGYARASNRVVDKLRVNSSTRAWVNFSDGTTQAGASAMSWMSLGSLPSPVKLRGGAARVVSSSSIATCLASSRESDCVSGVALQPESSKASEALTATR